MRILELGKFYPPHHGGIETLLRSLCEGFARRGAEVDCVVANDFARTEHQLLHGARVHRLASFGTVFSTPLCPAYSRATRRYRADIWHAHFPNPLADLACVRGPRDVPLVLSYHSDVVRQAGLMRAYRPLLLRLLRRADRIVVATPKHIEHSVWLPAFREKCEVIPYGINLEPLDATSELLRRAAELRAQAGGLPVLLNVGRLVDYKGQRYLIEAARNLKAFVWIVGTGPLKPALQALAGKLGIAERVRFWGSVDEQQLPAMLHACAVFVFPSITPNEAFGIAQVEAMACRKPVVSCSLASGVPFVNQDGITGLVVPPSDAVALARAIQRMLDDEALRRRLGEAALRRAREEFSEPVMVQRYWDCFERVRSAPRRA
jgi:glycosyltransferase involved in cell wall biosynthesis